MTNELDVDPLLWFDWADDESTSTAVIEAVADVAREDVTELPPLYECVDPDALDTMFSGTAHGVTPQSVEFSYNGYRVAVVASGVGWVA